ncbi:hypothetical protein [Burkholderia sp. BE17]|uniref:hypothetical protein n=1 Tax=Burkholderia sp. BE17 TaxID=2656644 RepID=UPI00128E86F1|nr:hypothetical protein [Burkholderia sp. BE17]MPV66234.1 hypothetical protein [Burkholderia sp. BE17]
MFAADTASTARYAPPLVNHALDSIVVDDPLDPQAGRGFEDARVLLHVAIQKALRIVVLPGSGSVLSMNDNGTAQRIRTDVFAINRAGRSATHTQI